MGRAAWILSVSFNHDVMICVRLPPFYELNETLKSFGIKIHNM